MVGKADEFFGMFRNPFAFVQHEIRKRFSLVMAIEIRQAKTKSFI